MKNIMQYMLASTALLLISVSSSFADSDHSLFEPILKENVQNGHVNYPGIGADPAFEQYLKELGQPLTTTDRDEQLVFWINAYNAFAIKGILDGRSPSTFFGRIGYFKNSKYEIGGRTISLFDLEHKVIIPFNEPRIHFAINCASGSCPKLLDEIYTVEKLEEQLESVAKQFISDSKRNRFDRKTKTAHLSKIFDWFEEDFEKHSGSIQKYVAQFVGDPELAEQLRNEEYQVKFLDYDWSLNGTPPK